MLLPSTFNTIPTWFLPIPENTAPALGVVDLSNLSGCAFSSSSTQSHPLHMTEKWCACSAPSVYL